MHSKMQLTVWLSILAAVCAPQVKDAIMKTLHAPAYNHDVTSQDHGIYIIHRSKTM